ncbi:MAG: GGDEF domain-containing protein [Lachnospiraceae bacterium]|nr:GGDEF domain-containing protein [Lachnospiraceae bacterium]
MRTELMRTVSVTSDIVTAIFLGIILAGYLYENKNVAERTKHYRYCLCICLAGLLFDAFSYITEGRIESDFAVTFINYLAFITIDPLIICFASFIRSRIEEKDSGYTSNVPNYITVICVLDIIFITIGVMSGKLFEIEGGVFTDGPWAGLVIIGPGICFTTVAFWILSKVKSLGIKEVMVMLLYIIMPGVSTILKVISEEIELGYVGSAMGLVLIYVIIMSKVISEADVRARMYSELSNLDALTGLKNRRGYEEAISRVKKDELVGAVFCDANALKETNDKLGHEEGDKLIKRIATILDESFPDGEVCRISGDEFVVVVRNALQKNFADRMKLLLEKIKANDRIASIGYEIGIGEKIEGVVKAAEEKMYIEKEKYYKETGKERRH